MTIEEYTSFFNARIAERLPAQRAQDLGNVLSAGDPKSIFIVLERVVDKGEICDAEFEKNLTDFYWQFCS